MKMPLFIAIFMLLITSVSAQNVSGKWYGKAFQGTGEVFEICNFELDLSQRKNIWGESGSYVKDFADIRVGIYGYFDGDTIRLEENKNIVLKNKTIAPWQACIKKIMVKYQKIGDTEFLIGRGSGESIEDNSPCMPVKFVFARNLNALSNYTAMYKDSLVPVVSYARELIPEFNRDFNKTSVNKITEIEVNHTNLKMRLYDYLQVDNDTVSVYLNRNSLAKNLKISKRPVKIDFKLDNRTGVNEILLFAENLGKVPPNTSLLEIIDGKQTYRLKIESDKQKTAAIYLRYKSN